MLVAAICHALPEARRRRRVRAESAILAVIRAHPWGVSACTIQEATGLGVGMLYEVLIYLEENGMVVGRLFGTKYPRTRIYVTRTRR